MWFQDDGYGRIGRMYVFGIFDKGLGHRGSAVFLGKKDISRWLRPVQAEEIMVA